MDTNWRPGDDRRSHPLAAWLGPALDQLTDEQLVRLTAESRAIDARYPDEDDGHLREAALSAAAQYLLGDTEPGDFGRVLTAARLAEAQAYAASQQVAAMLCHDNPRYETRAAELTGIDRMIVRRMLGKSGGRKPKAKD